MHPGNKAIQKYVILTTLTDYDLVDNWGEITILSSLDDVALLLVKFADSVMVKRLDPP